MDDDGGDAFAEAVADGLLERAGVDADGDRMWRLTPKGVARAMELAAASGFDIVALQDAVARGDMTDADFMRSVLGTGKAFDN